MEPAVDIVCLVGGGAIARHHAAAAAGLGIPEIRVADVSPAARESFAKDFPQARTFESADAMFASLPDAKLAVAIIAVPPFLHAATCIDALRAGCHVLCEKPFARDMAEVDAMLDAGREAGRMVGDCAIRFNDQPVMRVARSEISNGALGPINLIRMVHRAHRMRPGIEYQPESRWFLDREMSGGGVVMDWSVYDFAMLFDVLRPRAVAVESVWHGRIEGGQDPSDVPVEVESHVVAMLRLTLESGEKVPFLYERANGVNGPALGELSVEGRAAGLSWQWLPPYENGQGRLTRFRDGLNGVEEIVELLDMGQAPHFHHRPLAAFVDRIAGRASAAPDEADIRFRMALNCALYDVAETGRATVVERGADDG
jgi:predicted dehydrogenase